MEVTGAEGLTGKAQAWGARLEALRPSMGWAGGAMGAWYPHLGFCVSLS